MRKQLIPFLFTLLLAHGVYAHTGYPKDVKCPLDGQKFTIMVTASYTTFGSYKDFQKTGAIGDLYESMINSCPKCHFSGYEDDLETKYNKSQKEDIYKILEPYADMKMNDWIECEIAAKIYQYLNKKNDAIASIYLVGSYFLRTDGLQIDKRKELQNNCISYLIKALDAKEYEKKESYASIYYLVAELYRRVGNFDEAIKYFDLAINDKDKADWVLEVAKEQKALAEKKDDDNTI